MPLSIFVSNAVAGAGEEASGLLTMMKGLTGRGASSSFLCNLCTPEVLKVFITSGLA